MTYDIPMIFSAPLVRANLAGSKTMTRRMPTPILRKAYTAFKAREKVRLWQRETHIRYQMIYQRMQAHGGSYTEVGDGQCGYKADGFEDIQDFKDHQRLMADASFVGIEVKDDKFLPSIHMPRWASRFTGLVTDMRFEPVQDITEEEAVFEGIGQTHTADCPEGIAPNAPMNSDPTCGCDNIGYIEEFAELWASLHGNNPKKPGESWADNPKVFVIQYEGVNRNIDEVEDA